MEMELPSFDLSKAPHPKVVDLFAPLIPGFFFEASLVWGRPDLWQKVLGGNIGQYLRLGLLVFIAFFIGMTCLMGASLIQRGIRKAYTWRSGNFQERMKELLTMPRREETENLPSDKRGQFVATVLQRQDTFYKAYQVWIKSAETLLKNATASIPLIEFLKMGNGLFGCLYWERLKRTK
ncbi:MAG: hypothetical protein WB676_16485 [Bryobacteraceae bacterium]